MYNPKINGNLVQCTFPKCTKKSAREEIWPLQGFFSILLTLADVHPH